MIWLYLWSVYMWVLGMYIVHDWLIQSDTGNEMMSDSVGKFVLGVGIFTWPVMVPIALYATREKK